MDTARNENVVITELRESIEALVRERQQLRSSGASRRRLEANRLDLIRSQWALADALLVRYGRREAA